MNLINLIGKSLLYDIEGWYVVTYTDLFYKPCIIHIELVLDEHNRLFAICYNSNGKKYLLECRRMFDNTLAAERYVTYFLKPLKIVNR